MLKWKGGINYDYGAITTYFDGARLDSSTRDHYTRFPIMMDVTVSLQWIPESRRVRLCLLVLGTEIARYEDVTQTQPLQWFEEWLRGRLENQERWTTPLKAE